MKKLLSYLLVGVVFFMNISLAGCKNSRQTTEFTMPNYAIDFVGMVGEDPIYIIMHDDSMPKNKSLAMNFDIDSGLNITVVEFTEDGRIAKIGEDDVKYAYDTTGKLVRMTQGKAYKKENNFDVTYDSEGAMIINGIKYKYVDNKIKHIYRENADDSYIDLDYDENGRFIGYSEKYNDESISLKIEYDNKDRIFSGEYDHTSVDYSDGFKFRIAYDDNGFVTKYEEIYEDQTNTSKYSYEIKETLKIVTKDTSSSFIYSAVNGVTVNTFSKELNHMYHE